MKTTLIEHNNELYLVSDEKFNQDIPKGTEYYDGEGKIRIWGTGNCFSTLSKNILASEKSTPIGLIIPSDLMEVFKRVDVKQLAERQYPISIFNQINDTITNREAFIKGYLKYQQDNKDKRFTLEDMFNLLDVCKNNVTNNLNSIELAGRDFIESLSTPKKWKVEIEMEDVLLPNEEGIPNCFESLIPKLTKNSEGKECYTVTKLI